MNTTTAYAFVSGQIGFTETAVPKGALLLAAGPKEIVEQTVRGNARRSYDNETYLVPGCPEAETQMDAYEAFTKFFEHVNVQLGKHGLGQSLPNRRRAAKRGAAI